MKSLTTYIKRPETTPESILKEIKDFIKESGKDSFEVIVSEVSDLRSSCQNKFYFGAVIPAFLEAFIGSPLEAITSKDLCHEYLKELFLRTNKKGIAYTKSTAELTVEEFSEYIDKCIDYLVVEFQGIIYEKDRKTYELSLGQVK